MTKLLDVTVPLWLVLSVAGLWTGVRFHRAWDRR